MLIICTVTHIVDVVNHSENVARAHIRLMAVTIILLWLRLMKNARAFALLGTYLNSSELFTMFQRYQIIHLRKWYAFFIYITKFENFGGGTFNTGFQKFKNDENIDYYCFWQLQKFLCFGSTVISA